VGYIDETPWYGENALEWLWVMASEQVAFYTENSTLLDVPRIP